MIPRSGRDLAQRQERGERQNHDLDPANHVSQALLPPELSLSAC
jgi:hypothetical protein